jgi:hypothetical protein
MQRSRSLIKTTERSEEGTIIIMGSEETKPGIQYCQIETYTSILHGKEV